MAVGRSGAESELGQGTAENASSDEKDGGPRDPIGPIDCLSTCEFT